MIMDWKSGKQIQSCSKLQISRPHLGDTEENHKITPSVWSIDDRNVNKNIPSRSSVGSILNHLTPNGHCMGVPHS